MADADFQTDAIRQFLQPVLEHVAISRVTSASIAEYQQRRGVRIICPPEVFPPVRDAITGKRAGVVTDADVEVAVVALEVVKAVRVDDATRQRRKVVVIGFDDLLGIGVPLPEEVADQFLLLGIDAENGRACVFVEAAVVVDDLELAVPLRVVLLRAFLQSFTSPHLVLGQQLGDDGNADTKATCGQLLRQSPQREVSPQHSFPHRISGRVRTNDVQEGGIKAGEQRQARFPAAPFFRDRPGAREGF